MKIPFGKHRGKDVEEVPDDYLLWFLEQEWASEWIELFAYCKKNERAIRQNAAEQQDDDGGIDGKLRFKN